MINDSVVDSIDNGVGNFVAEESITVDDEIPLFDPADYPEEQRELLKECNRRIEEANSKYRIAKFREERDAIVKLFWDSVRCHRELRIRRSMNQKRRGILIL